MEDKQKILNLLANAIRATRAGSDLVGMRYDKDNEIVHVDFVSGLDGRLINVAMDSGIAMIRDVLIHIDIG